MESDTETVLTVLDSLGVEYAREAGGRAKICCPFHEEKTPSMTIYDSNSCYCFGCQRYCWHDELIAKIANCTLVEAKKKLGTYDPNVNYGAIEKISKFKLPTFEFAEPASDLSDLYAKLPEEVPGHMKEFIESKGLWPAAVEIGGWRWCPRGTLEFWPKQDGICIPYYNFDGKITTFRLRRYDNMRQKYGHPLAPKGLSLQASYFVANPVGPVYFCEGESDSLSLRSIGRNVICLPGVGARKQLHSAIMQCFAWGSPMLIFCGDNDEAGQAFNTYAAKATVTLGLGRYKPQIRTLKLPKEFNKLPEGGFKRKDINDFLCEGRLEEIIATFENGGIYSPILSEPDIIEADTNEQEQTIVDKVEQIMSSTGKWEADWHVEELDPKEVEGIFD